MQAQQETTGGESCSHTRSPDRAHCQPKADGRPQATGLAAACPQAGNASTMQLARRYIFTVGKRTTIVVDFCCPRQAGRCRGVCVGGHVGGAYDDVDLDEQCPSHRRRIVPGQHVLVRGQA